MAFLVQAKHPNETEWFDIKFPDVELPIRNYIDALAVLRRYNETCENENDRVRIVEAETGKMIIETDAWMH